jgi:PAS domain S-box-containing protein
VEFQYNVLILPLIIAAAACAGLVILAWKRPTVPGSRAFVWLALALSSWSLEYALELGSIDLAAKVFWAKLQFFSIVGVPVAWLSFVLEYTGRRRWMTAHRILLLSIVPIATLLLVLTHSYHSLIFTHMAIVTQGTDALLLRSFGQWFWLHTFYAYTLLLIGTFLLVRGLYRTPHRYRGQAGALLVAVCAPVAANAVYLTGISPFGAIDLTPFGFNITALALAWGIFRGRLLETIPIAYDDVLKSMSDGVLILDDQHRILDLNAAAHFILNPQNGEVVGGSALNLLAAWPELLEKLQCTTDQHEEIVFACNNRKHFYDLRISPIFNHQYLAGRLVVLRDITKRKQYENALRDSEERFRRAFSQALTGMVLVSLEGDFLAVNPYICQMTGYREQELLEKNVKDITHPEDLETELEKHRDLVSGNAPMVLLEKRYIRKDGQTVWGRLSSSILKDSGGDPLYILAHVQDITEQKQVEAEKKRLEVQTQVVQRLEALGTLAGGIAHDFNNILMSIQGNVSLLKQKVTSGQTPLEKLQNIEHYIQSGARLTQQLLGFARGGKYEVKPINLKEVIEKTAQMFGRTRKEINIVSAFDPRVWTVNADQSQLEQVLLNLYVNASQAMPDGGSLFLQTANTVLDENYIKPYKIKPGCYVKISVTDTGSGMDALTQQRIFEPFFTTKEMGRGTGLGLASVYGIIKNHGGYINVYSEKDVGTTFNLYFPAVEHPAAAESNEKALTAVNGTETVLFVDDEEMIVSTGREILGELGYRVITALSGQEALDLFSDNSGKIDLVILDMIMPNMTGKDTYLKMKALNPDVRVLLSSGYSLNDQALAIMDRGCDGFIQKPFSAIELSHKIREILEAKN